MDHYSGMIEALKCCYDNPRRIFRNQVRQFYNFKFHEHNRSTYAKAAQSELLNLVSAKERH